MVGAPSAVLASTWQGRLSLNLQSLASPDAHVHVARHAPATKADSSSDVSAKSPPRSPPACLCLCPWVAPWDLCPDPLLWLREPAHAARCIQKHAGATLMASTSLAVCCGHCHRTHTKLKPTISPNPDRLTTPPAPGNLPRSLRASAAAALASGACGAVQHVGNPTCCDPSAMTHRSFMKSGEPMICQQQLASNWSAICCHSSRHPPHLL